jgi:hypothetical protein
MDLRRRRFWPATCSSIGCDALGGKPSSRQGGDQSARRQKPWARREWRRSITSWLGGELSSSTWERAAAEFSTSTVPETHRTHGTCGCGRRPTMTPCSAGSPPRRTTKELTGKAGDHGCTGVITVMSSSVVEEGRPKNAGRDRASTTGTPPHTRPWCCCPGLSPTGGAMVGGGGTEVDGQGGGGWGVTVAAGTRTPPIDRRWCSHCAGVIKG